MNDFKMLFKVEINPSYDWAKQAEGRGISHRELEVFALKTEGYSNKEVAQILKIQHQSVKNHVYSLAKKLNVSNSVQALVIALQMNLIKLQAKLDYRDTPNPIEVTSEAMINSFRDIISGQTWSSGVNEKTKRKLKVMLKEIGIDPYKW
ncbi:response regulator transcription factor [Chloroflexota bacterium]